MQHCVGDTNFAALSHSTIFTCTTSSSLHRIAGNFRGCKLSECTRAEEVQKSAPLGFHNYGMNTSCIPGVSHSASSNPHALHQHAYNMEVMLAPTPLQ